MNLEGLYVLFHAITMGHLYALIWTLSTQWVNKFTLNRLKCTQIKENTDDINNKSFNLDLKNEYHHSSIEKSEQSIGGPVGGSVTRSVDKDITFFIASIYRVNTHVFCFESLWNYYHWLRIGFNWNDFKQKNIPLDKVVTLNLGTVETKYNFEHATFLLHINTCPARILSIAMKCES